MTRNLKIGHCKKLSRELVRNHKQGLKNCLILPVQKDCGLVCHRHVRCGTELSTRLLFDHVLSFMLSQTKFSVFGSLNEFKCLTCSQEHLVAERGSKETFEHGTSEERKNEIEMLIHEEPKQAHDGDGRRILVENASYGEPESFYGRLRECASGLRRVKSLRREHKRFEKTPVLFRWNSMRLRRISPK